MNSRVDSFFTLTVVRDGQLRGDSVDGADDLGHHVAVPLVVDDLARLSLVLPLICEAPDDEGLWVRLHDALEGERLARGAAQHREAGQDGGGD